MIGVYINKVKGLLKRRPITLTFPLYFLGNCHYDATYRIHGLMQSVTGCKVHHLEIALSFSHCCQVQKL